MLLDIPKCVVVFPVCVCAHKALSLDLPRRQWGKGQLLAGCVHATVHLHGCISEAHAASRSC